MARYWDRKRSNWTTRIRSGQPGSDLPDACRTRTMDAHNLLRCLLHRASVVYLSYSRARAPPNSVMGRGHMAGVLLTEGYQFSLFSYGHTDTLAWSSKGARGRDSRDVVIIREIWSRLREGRSTRHRETREGSPRGVRGFRWLQYPLICLSGCTPSRWQLGVRCE